MYINLTSYHKSMQLGGNHTSTAATQLLTAAVPRKEYKSCTNHMLCRLSQSLVCPTYPSFNNYLYICNYFQSTPYMLSQSSKCPTYILPSTTLHLSATTSFQTTRTFRQTFFNLFYLFYEIHEYHIYPTRPLGQDMTQGQFLSRV